METVKKTPDPIIVKMQTVGILLVVAGHMFPETKNGCELPYIPFLIKNWIYSFHMPFFMFISGFLFFFSNSKRRFDYTGMIIKKVHRLLLPFVAISCIALIPKHLLSGFANRTTELTFHFFLKIFYIPDYNPIVYFWFLQALFLIFIFSFIFLILSKKNFPVLAVTSLILLLLPVFIKNVTTIFSINKSLNVVFYFWLGMLAARYRNYGTFCRNPFVIVSSFTIISILLYLYSIFNLNENLVHLLKLIAALSGIIMCIGIANRWASVKNDYFTYIDGFSYQIYLLSWFSSVFFRIPYQIGIYDFYIASLLRFFSGIFLPVVLSRFALKQKTFFNAVIGL